MQSASPALIVVTGLPCAGKSTLAARLRAASGWPLLAKDDFKETLFATLGWRDREWSRRLSIASYALLLRCAQELLAVRQSVIVEGNFRAEELGERFDLLAEGAMSVVQILCSAAPAQLVARWDERMHRATRHPGHLDAENAAAMKVELQRPCSPLPLNGVLLEWDSTTPDENGLDQLVTAALQAARHS